MGGKKRWLKFGICLLLCGALAISIPQVSYVGAKVTQSDLNNLQNQLNQLKNQQKELDKKLAETKDEKNRQQEYKNSLDEKISNVQQQIDLLNQQISGLDAQIQEKSLQIEETSNKIDANMEQLKKRLKAIYMMGENSDLEMLFSAKSFAEYMDRLELVRGIAKHDSELIETLKSDRSSIEGEKTSIQADREQVAEAKKDFDAQKAELSRLIAESNRVLKNLNNQEQTTLAQQQELARKYAQVDKEIENWYREWQLQQQQSGNGQQYVGGTFLWPMPGYAGKKNLGDGFGAGRNHTGIDIVGANIYGKTAVAANSGVVAYATNVNTAVYGKYLIIDHGGTISTLYGHCSQVLVKAGDKITKGQPIALVGMTGVATGPHLHFSVLINGTPVNPMQYFTLQ